MSDAANLAFLMALFFLLGAACVLRGVFLLSSAGGWIVLGLLFFTAAAWPVVRRRWLE